MRDGRAFGVERERRWVRTRGERGSSRIGVELDFVRPVRGSRCSPRIAVPVEVVRPLSERGSWCAGCRGSPSDERCESGRVGNGPRAARCLPIPVADSGRGSRGDTVSIESGWNVECRNSGSDGAAAEEERRRAGVASGV